MSVTTEGETTGGAIARDVADAEFDSIHVLPLSLIPLQVRGLSRLCLIKNARLETVVEMFRTDEGAGGQIPINELGKYFSDREALMQDMAILQKLSILRSFDVYTLRAELRRLGIAVTSSERLRLSESKKAQLVGFMKEFTRPLLQRVYGGQTGAVSDFEQLIGLFSQPNKEEALRNLKLLASHLQVSLGEIPNFLEEYGDVFLSMAYFRSIFGTVLPLVTDLRSWSREIAKGYQFKDDKAFQRACDGMTENLGKVAGSITTIFDGFDKTAKSFWDEISMVSFNSLRLAVSQQHTTMGALLCGLYVKTDAWDQQFNRGRRAAPQKCADYILSEMIPGLKSMQESLKIRASIIHPPRLGSH